MQFIAQVIWPSLERCLILFALAASIAAVCFQSLHRLPTMWLNQPGAIALLWVWQNCQSPFKGNKSLVTVSAVWLDACFAHSLSHFYLNPHWPRTSPCFTKSPCFAYINPSPFNETGINTNMINTSPFAPLIPNASPTWEYCFQFTRDWSYDAPSVISIANPSPNNFWENVLSGTSSNAMILPFAGDTKYSSSC